MAGMLAMFGGSMASGLLGPLLGAIPNIPGAAITNPYAGMTSTGGNSVGAPLFDMFGNFLGGGSGSSGSTPYTTPYTSGANSGYYISQAPATTTTTTTSSIDPNIILLGGAAIIAIVLLK